MKKLLLLLLCSFLYLNAQTIEVYGATATKATLEELKKEFLKDRKDDEIIYLYFIILKLFLLIKICFYLKFILYINLKTFMF